MIVYDFNQNIKIGSCFRFRGNSKKFPLRGMCMYKICNIAYLAVLEDVAVCANQRPSACFWDWTESSEWLGTLIILALNCPPSLSQIILATDTNWWHSGISQLSSSKIMPTLLDDTFSWPDLLPVHLKQCTTDAHETRPPSNLWLSRNQWLDCILVAVIASSKNVFRYVNPSGFCSVTIWLICDAHLLMFNNVIY